MGNNNNPELKARAKMLAKVVEVLFIRKGLSAKLATANRGARHLSLGVRLNDALQIDKALSLSEPLAAASGTQRVLAQRQSGLVVYQFELKQGFWQSYTRQDLPRVENIGLAEKRKPIDFDFKQPHALIAGSTNSGKSETVKSIMLSLMQGHEPGELGIVLIDLHSDYDGFENEAHLIRFGYGSIAHENDDIDTALLWVNSQLANRKREGVKDDRRIVLIIDEADKVLSDDKRLAIVQSISTEGRKFNVNVIIGTQKPSHKTLPKILDNLLNRFIGLVSDAQVSANLTGKSGLQAHLLTGSGDFIHTVGADSERFQVAIATQQDFNRLERCQLEPVIVDSQDYVELPTELDKGQAGRPKLELQADLTAWYLYHYPTEISRATAAGIGISRNAHELHKDFAGQVAQHYLKLQAESLLKLGGVK